MSIKNSIRFGIKKIGIGNSFGIGFVKILGILGGISVSKLFLVLIWYRQSLVLKKISDSVLKIFGFEKSIGFGIGKIWYQKFFWIRFLSDFTHTSV